MKISVIICAAGSGRRADLGRNKLLAPFMGANALYFTLSRVDQLKNALSGTDDEITQIIVAAAKEDFAETEAYALPFGAKTVTGGSTRTESVYNALKEVNGEMVLIQDGARPFTTLKQFTECIECAKTYNSAVTAMPATDTTVTVKNGYTDLIPPRDSVYSVQTPQAFAAEQIKRAYKSAIESGGLFTDDGSVYSAFVAPARICPCGTPENRKLTFKEDFEVLDAAKNINLRDGRVGFGVDVHPFGRVQNFVTLCGVKIPCDEGLVAHSDGDAAIHAVTDAVLSAAGLKDIGHYFPDTDMRYKDADSTELLKTAVEQVRRKGLEVAGLSVAIQAEKPRLARYIDEMAAKLCLITGAKRDSVSISAGTCEGLGFVGEGRGVCAYCAAVLKKINKG